MEHCAHCGRRLGAGRYCTNCGRPVGTRPADIVRADEPPPAWAPPPPARYPLYADEVGRRNHDSAATHRPGRPRRPWVAVATVLVLMVGVGVGAALLGTTDPAEQPPPDAHTGDPAAIGGPVTNLAADATVTVPATGAPGADVAGEPVSYRAENMLDGVPETAWRMPGDGTGEEIVITLARESRLHSVGLINGYAKPAPGRDWYHGNRRIQRVQWIFDDGTVVDQDLDDTTEMQSVEVEVTTTAITLRLVAVSKPGQGRDRRDNTVLSDLSLLGNSPTHPAAVP